MRFDLYYLHLQVLFSFFENHVPVDHISDIFVEHRPVFVILFAVFFVYRSKSNFSRWLHSKISGLVSVVVMIWQFLNIP